METTVIPGYTAIDVLKEDHDAVRDLFRRVDEAASDRRRKLLGDRCLRRLEAHFFLERTCFYPAVRRDLGEESMIARALQEHDAARRVMHELKELAAGERYNTRLRALREIVLRHLEDEEAVLLARVEKSDMDIEQLGALLLAKKRRLKAGEFLPGPLADGGLSRAAAVAAGVALVAGAVLLARRLGRR